MPLGLDFPVYMYYDSMMDSGKSRDLSRNTANSGQQEHILLRYTIEKSKSAYLSPWETRRRARRAAIIPPNLQIAFKMRSTHFAGVLKPIFHCDAKPFALGPGVGLDPQRHNFALKIPTLKFALPPTRNIKAKSK